MTAGMTTFMNRQRRREVDREDKTVDFHNGGFGRIPPVVFGRSGRGAGGHLERLL
jgi:hypothetical protein